MLDVEVVTVPHFYDGDGEKVSEDGDRMLREYLLSCDLALQRMILRQTLPFVFTMMTEVNPGLYYIMTARDVRGVTHACIYCGDRLIWDPGTGEGLAGTLDDGLVCIETFVPRRLTELTKEDVRVSETA